ncbi:MAG: purine-nucleoside phosphorylase [Actinomycetaceae bacterium]|nr:purine-nucleoside phosphorylase [Actinomycetaceae bacterium]MDY6083110.1 purine-nucleoside phosphorylase [Actinomycetaceae bacterium]
MATPHIDASYGDFAPAVLMPGDPLRAQRMASILMPDAQLVTHVRGITGFTGELHGKPLSIMASGMGQPSLAIYATELFTQFGVQRIVRVGTAGSLRLDVHPGDVVIAMGAHTDSNFNDALVPGVRVSAVASYRLLSSAVAAADESMRVFVGTVHSADHFYGNPESQTEDLAAVGTLAVEMETAALYGLGAKFGKEALSVLTISDSIVNPEENMGAQERETTFQKALKLAVAAALSDEN